MEKIIDYIKQRYHPLSILVYGSFADGTNNEHSDFDALVISKNNEKYHDDAFVDGIQLDVFVYPISYIEEKAWNCSEFIQLADSRVVFDTNEQGMWLKDQVLDYIKRLPCKTAEEVRTEVEWCKKMLLRTQRKDAEGMFRWHWLLTESLEIFCDAVRHPYLGPKKSMRWMEKQYPEAYACYAKALFELKIPALEVWIVCLERHISEE